MGEFQRKTVSRRLLALNAGEMAALTTAIRQLGDGSQGGAKAFAIFHPPTLRRVGLRIPDRTAFQNQSRREKLLGDD